MTATSAVGLYLHIPYCQKKCPYCAFYSEPIGTRDPAALIGAMRIELDLYEITEPVETIYIGGGSPTCLPHDVLVDLVKSLNKRFGQVEEFTLECNPAQADTGLFKQLKALGVNRLSIGAQSFEAAELQTLGRIHNPGQIYVAVQMVKDAGYENIGLDLIFGIPHSTVQTWKASLEAALALGVQHISAYSLTIEAGTPFEKAVREGTLSGIDEQTERSMYEASQLMLKEAGFMQYEISNFAKPGYECKHNLRYWKNLPVIGIGPAAGRWYKGKRTINVADISEYIEKIQAGQFAYAEEDAPGPEQTASETAVLGLRMTCGIDLNEYKKATGFELFSLFGNAIKQHCSNGLLECDSTHCRLTEKGLSYADTVAQDFVL